jgi:hypothetical protein
MARFNASKEAGRPRGTLGLTIEQIISIGLSSGLSAGQPGSAKPRDRRNQVGAVATRALSLSCINVHLDSSCIWPIVLRIAN